MNKEPQDELKKKWETHSAIVERNKLIEQINNILNVINSSNLNKPIKQTLTTFYQEIRTTYADLKEQDLINKAQELRQYADTYLADQNKFLIIGVLAQSRLNTPEIISEVEVLLAEPQQKIREQSIPLRAALKDVEPYAIHARAKLDGDFYEQEEDNTKNNFKC